MSSPVSSILNSPPHTPPLANSKPTSMKKIKLDKRYFEIKSDIKPWLQRNLCPFNIDIVIERSDDTKIVFKCKYKTNTKNNQKNNKVLCPFRIRSNYSIRLKVWTLVIVNDDIHSDEKLSVLLSNIKDALNTSDKDTLPSAVMTSSATVSAAAAASSPFTSFVSKRHSFDETNSQETKKRKIDDSLSAYPVSISTLPITPTSSNSNLIKSSVYSLLDSDPESLHIQTQVRRIEDTLKDLEKFTNIPTNSKEQIFNNVLNVLNSSITQAKSNPTSNSSSPPAATTTAGTIAGTATNMLPLLPPLTSYNLTSYDNNKIVLPSIRFNHL